MAQDNNHTPIYNEAGWLRGMLESYVSIADKAYYGDTVARWTLPTWERMVRAQIEEFWRIAALQNLRRSSRPEPPPKDKPLPSRRSHARTPDGSSGK